MRIAILTAMEKERSMLLPIIENKNEAEIDGLKVVFGHIHGKEVAVAKCGIGKVNSAINTYKIIKTFHPDLLINSGVAGGAGSISKIGDLLVADYVAYHDVWCGPETDIGAADGMEVFMKCDDNVIKIAHNLFDGQRLLIGLICSGDRFITQHDEIIEIRRNFPEVVAVDMESASIAQVCSMEGVKFNIIRVISDTPGEGENISQYENFWIDAPRKTFEALGKIIKDL